MDELIAQLVGMGFEFQDAQQAIQVGKLSVADAIEWFVLFIFVSKVAHTSMDKLAYDV